ncbi:MAG: cytochrome c3 family protein [Dehalococcoidia bacterium]|nr:cytochrome c3 family protein [Dehalococcoidia bacterium]
MPRPLVILVAATLVVVVLIIVGYSAAASRLSQAPEQPIAFSHSFHVSDIGLQCMFCHRNAASSVEAGLPQVEQCMFCHTVVGAGNAEIEKVRTAFANQKPIDWKRVYRVPDIVRFTHEPHIRAQLDCSACHGQVEKMTLARPAGPLGMAQCVSCHRQRGAPADCEYCHY